ncbi:hypothetical protein PIB30_002604 [Stylosanthes scabra]|uniref:R13L1/DRL21-like LRR repeat region domain-containing protein n=1 Tax=Stylosanthes scabra TaxID=79078 RepID=A0ABU6Z1V2_9FABA|nr:hypothetical protein [Stylosanthes scabra]
MLKKQGVQEIIEKTHIEELCLEWSSGGDDLVSNTQTERDILDSLQPHNGLKELRIKGYKGTIFPKWVGSFSFYNMTSVYLASCNNCCMLPSLEELPSLQSLHIEGFSQLKSIGMEFYKNEDSHQSSIVEPFRSLQNLEFHDMPCWEEWDLAGNRLPTYLQELSIRHCRKLEFLKRQMIKYGLVELRIHDSCDSLTSFSVDDFPCLKVLDISVCSNLESVSISDPPHVALRRLSIHSCSKFVSFPGEILAAPNLIHFSVIMCSKFEALPCLMESLLPNLEFLFVQGCPGICRLLEGGLPTKLKELRLGVCEEQLKALSSMGNMDNLTSLTILGSSEVRSYLELHLLPRLPSLKTLHLWGVHDLEELDCDELLRLSSLQRLQISYCEKLENMCGEKLPSSLLLLQIQDCPLLEQHCKNKNQEIWSKISHIPIIQVNAKQIF